ncbi:MAG: hypothetical protein KCHDKBKB_02260 [Elusimicrobia bacterium]|nr:hypothetical protein [Elusimicrobiota bacterium]
MKTEVFRINHYVGGLLAQGGNIWLEGSKIMFSPTSALDRAMGAKDLEIPFQKIRGVEFKGDLLRAFSITTIDQTHKFEGTQARKVWEILDRSLKSNSSSSSIHSASTGRPTPASTSSTLNTPTSSSFTCHQCSKTLEPGFSFCPSCGTRPKSMCSSCHKTVSPSWIICAFCGWKFSSGTSGGLNK